MANFTGDSTPIPKMDRATGQADPLIRPEVQYATQAAGNIGAFSDDAQQLAGGLDNINSQVNTQMDRIASAQGEQAGTVAGANGDVPLKNNGTISGDAYDAAAVRTMLATHDVAARQAADNIYLQNKDNPAAMQTQLSAYANGVMSSSLPDAVKADFKINFGNISNVYLQDSQARAKAQVMDNDRAAYLSSLDERQKTMGDLAMRAANDPTAAATLAQQQDALQKFAISYGPKGAFTLDGVNYPADEKRAGISSAADIQQLLINSSNQAQESRVLGKFSQLQTLPEQRNYLQAFDQAFGKGESPDGGDNPFSQEQSQRLMAQMHQQLEQKQNLARGQLLAIKSGYDNFKQQMSQGFSPGADAVNSLVTQAQATGDPAALALGQMAKGLTQFNDIARQATPAQLQGTLNTMRTQANQDSAAGKSPNPLLEEQVDMGDKLLANMNTELKRDPLSWGARVGVTPLAPLDGTPASAAARVQAAQTVAAHYNTPLQLLTSEEAQQWKDQWSQGTPDQKTAMVQQIQQNFGSNAPAAYADLSKASPGIANVGALLASSPAHMQTVRDYAIGDAMLQGPDKMLPPSKQVSTTLTNTLGDAYGFAPGAQAAVADTASRLYAARAARQGLTPETYSDDLYSKAAQESAGAWWAKDGTQYGGVVEQKGGHNIVLPPNMTEDQFNSTLKNMSDADVVKASANGLVPRGTNGDPFTADDLRDSYLISTGPGKYLVSTVNPKKSGQPVLVQTGGPGAHYTLDLSKLNGPAPKGNAP